MEHEQHEKPHRGVLLNLDMVTAHSNLQLTTFSERAQGVSLCCNATMLQCCHVSPHAYPQPATMYPLPPCGSVAHRHPSFETTRARSTRTRKQMMTTMMGDEPLKCATYRREKNGIFICVQCVVMPNRTLLDPRVLPNAAMCNRLQNTDTTVPPHPARTATNVQPHTSRYYKMSESQNVGE